MAGARVERFYARDENPRVAERMLVRARTHLDGVSINSGPQFRLFTR